LSNNIAQHIKTIIGARKQLDRWGHSLAPFGDIGRNADDSMVI